MRNEAGAGWTDEGDKEEGPHKGERKAEGGGRAQKERADRGGAGGKGRHAIGGAIASGRNGGERRAQQRMYGYAEGGWPEETGKRTTRTSGGRRADQKGAEGRVLC